MTADEKEIRRKLAVLKKADEIGSAAKAYRYFGIPRSTYFRWRKAFSIKVEKPIGFRKKSRLNENLERH